MKEVYINKQDGPKASLSNKSSNRIPCSTRYLLRSNLNTVNKCQRHKGSVYTHDQDNLSTVQSQTDTLGCKTRFKPRFQPRTNSSVRSVTVSKKKQKKKLKHFCVAKKSEDK